MSCLPFLFSRPHLVWTLTALAVTTAVHGADHDNLEAGLPTSIVDAYPIPFRALEMQLALGYQKPDATNGGLVITPRLELGALPNMQISAGVEIITDGVRRHSGDLAVDALYGFTQETLWLPGLAVAADLAFPTGVDSQGVRGTAMAVLTKGLVPSWPDRWHVNVGWELLSDAQDGEREHRFVAMLGYSRSLTTDLVLVADGVRRQGETVGSSWETAAELGVRRQITPLAVASLGGGLDFADHVGYTQVRVVLGLQHSF